MFVVIIDLQPNIVETENKQKHMCYCNRLAVSQYNYLHVEKLYINIDW